MPKVKLCVDNNTKKANGNLYFKCPATGKTIEISTQTAWNSKQIVHSYNQNADSPTITPAILIVNGVQAGHGDPVNLGNAAEVNHFIIQNGNIRYLDDSTHHLKGRTVALPEL